jgi:hypothetical protein
MTTNNDNPPSPEIIDLDPEAVTDHDKPSVGSDTPKRAPMAGMSRPLLFGVALLAAALAGGWLYKDYLWRYLPSDDVSALVARTKALEDGNTAMREQVATLERLAAQLKADIDSGEVAMSGAASSAKAASDSVASLSGRVDAVGTALDDLSKRHADLAARLAATPAAGGGSSGTAVIPDDILNRLVALEKDVASLKGAGESGAADTALLSQSLSDLKAKIGAGAAYGDELARLERLVPAAPGLDVLKRHAATGLPDTMGLARELSELAPTLPTAGELAPPVAADDSWAGWALDKLSGLVTIRVAGATDWKRVAEAAAALAGANDLPQAVEHVGAAEGTRPASLQRWLDRASQRLDLEDKLKAVDDAVLRVIAAKG